VDDEEFASMLIGIQPLKDFKKIIYRRNVFMQDSLDAMLPILQRKVPHHLEELRIENVKISPDITSQLFDALHERSYLTKLGLVNMNFNAYSFQKFCDFIETSNTLEEFDISWAKVGHLSLEVLLEVLSRNRTLKTVNLAHN